MLTSLLTFLLLVDPSSADGGSAPAPSRFEVPPLDEANFERLTLSGERQLHDGQRKLSTVEGNAKLRGDGLAIDADRIVYDEVNSAATASGHVVVRIARHGLAAVTGEVVTLRLDGEDVTDVYVVEGRAETKKDTTAEALLAAETVEALDRTGKTQVLLEGNHLVHRGAIWSSEHLLLVPCECDFSKPSWGVEAFGASVDTEHERVSLSSPVVRVYHVPVLWFPWLSLPLNDRQSGLLFPKPGYNVLNGFSLDVPVFVTLGRSADVSLTPGFFTGGTSGPSGVMGPRLLTELRYVPSTRATGRLFIGALWDFKPVRDPLFAPLVGTDARGLRGELSWTHAQDFDGGFGVRAELSAYSDGYYNRDLTTDVIATSAGLLRSGATAFHRGEHHLLTLDLTLRQDLVFGYDWLGRAPNVPMSTSPRFGPGVLQRLPALTLTVPRVTLAGPLSVDLTGEFVRLAPLFSLTGDEGAGAREVDGFDQTGEVSWDCRTQRAFGFGGQACGEVIDKQGQGDRLWQRGEREARDRLMVFPRAWLAGRLGPVATSAWVGWRQSLWAGEASQRTWQRGVLVADARAELELSKVYGTVRHTLQPLVAVRAVPLILTGSSDATSAEPVPYDEVDASVPRGGMARAQAIVELRQRLVRRGGAELARLDLGQGFRLLAPGQSAGLAESYGRLSTQIGWFRLQLSARMEPTTARLTRLGGQTAFDDGAGHGISLFYENLLDDGSDLTRAPIDLLFGDVVPSTSTRAQTVGAGAWWKFGPVGLRYDVQLTQRKWLATDVDPVLALGQHGLSVSFAPACDCWRLEVAAIQRLKPDNSIGVPEFAANLTVSRFGSIGTR